MKKLFILLMTLLCLVSCKTEIELEQADYEQKIVVDGWIESGNFANVFLTLSSPFLTNYDSASISQTFLKYAKITLSCSNGDMDTLVVFPQKNTFPPFVYKTTRMKGITGCTYQLMIETRGKTITASTTIPAAPVIDNLRMETVSDSSGYLLMGVQPSTTEKLHLFVQVKSKLADRNFHPSKIPVCLLHESNRMQEIYVYRTTESNLLLSNDENYYYKDWNRYLYSLKDTLQVKVGMIDVESYQVLKSLYADQSMQVNPFAFNTAGIQSNIVGGIGRWTGIGLAPLKVYYGK